MPASIQMVEKLWKSGGKNGGKIVTSIDVSTIFPSKSHLAPSPPFPPRRFRPRRFRPVAAPRAAHAAAPSDEWRRGRTGSGRRPGAPGDAGHQVGVFLRKTYWWMENVGFLYVTADIA